MTAGAPTMNSRFSAILLTVLLALSVVPMGVMPAGAEGTGSRAYTTHATILIANDAQFTAANGVTTGTGTSTAPYIIEGWEISAASTNGIMMTGTTKYFIIQKCRFKDIGTGFNGVAMQNVDNAVVKENEFVGTGAGLTLQNTDGAQLSQNTFSGLMSSLIFQNANLNAFKGNTITNGGTGLSIQNANNNTIEENKVSGATNVAAIQNSDNNTFKKNEFGGGTGGAELENAYDNTFTLNTFHDLTQAAVEAASTANNKFHHNNFKSNAAGGKQAITDNPNDLWDDGSKGNYWSDWTTPDANSDGVVDTPYTLQGGFDTDRYPLTTEVGGTTPPPPIAVTILADKNAGDYPLAVNFTSSASGGTPPYGYTWSFGDGGTATTATASHTFTTAGNFTVTMTVKDSKSVSKTSDGIVIKVTKPIPPLDASISTDKLTGKAPLALKFTSSVSGGVPPYTYAWTFDDGDISTEANPNHTYKKSGTYTAKLKVTDSKGKEKLVDKIIIVLPKDIPKPGFIPGFEGMVLVIAVVLGLLLIHRKR